ncbi:MAG: DNA metabolism protein [Eubacterium sp.]|jgi:probable DNA metabolism protein|nr:DNA metabolism protein [Eubacterium sp.]
MYVYHCENSIDGIFTGVYDAWASRRGHKNIRLSSAEHQNLTLFSEYITVVPDFEKSRKVSRTLIERLGPGFYDTICRCAMADGNCRKLTMDKANAIYQTIVMALALPEGAKVLEYLGEPCIACIFELCRQTSNEAHHLLEFLRFSELKNGILFAQIHPKNDVLPILADHFTNRLPLENFIIYDAVHRTAAVHSASKNYIIADASTLDLTLADELSQAEETFRNLWCAFFESIAIKDRANAKLQIQNIPKRFWADTIELKDKL